MNARLPSWALLGALLASVSMNLAQWSEPSNTPEPTPLSAEQRVEQLKKALDPETLGLTSEQIERIKSCGVNCCDERDSLIKAVAEKEAELRAALETSDVDDDRARAVAAELGALRAQCIRNGVESILLVRKVLTEDQVADLVQCFDQCCGTALGDGKRD